MTIIYTRNKIILTIIIFDQVIVRDGNQSKIAGKDGAGWNIFTETCYYQTVLIYMYQLFWIYKPTNESYNFIIKAYYRSIVTQCKYNFNGPNPKLPHEEAGWNMLQARLKHTCKRHGEGAFKYYGGCSSAHWCTQHPIAMVDRNKSWVMHNKPRSVLKYGFHMPRPKIRKIPNAFVYINSNRVYFWQ